MVKVLLCHLLLVLLLDLEAGDLGQQYVLCLKRLPSPILGLSSVHRGPQLSPEPQEQYLHGWKDSALLWAFLLQKQGGQVRTHPMSPT